jgi:hypothetical protein
MKRHHWDASGSLKGWFRHRFFRLALAAPLPYHRRRTGGRVVECTALEMRRTCKGIVGSNPTLSATLKVEPNQVKDLGAILSNVLTRFDT